MQALTLCTLLTGCSLAMLAVNGCGRGDGSDKTRSPGSIKVNNNRSALANRIELVSEEIPLVTGTNLAATQTFLMTLVGKLDPPSHAGTRLQANMVTMKGAEGKTLVAYNVAGDTQRGGLELIDTRTETAPRVQSQLFLSEGDVNGAQIFGDNIYFTGALKKVDAGDVPAYIARTKISGFELSSSVTMRELPSFAGNSIFAHANAILASSGDEGGVTSFSASSWENSWSVDIADSRSVLAVGDSVWVLGGQPGLLHFLHAADGSQMKAPLALGGLSIPQAKAMLFHGKEVSLASLGEEGFAAICNADGALIGKGAAVTGTGDDDKTVTNAVASVDDMVFSASGEAGVWAYRITTSTSVENSCGFTASFEKVGYLDFGAGFSANHIYINKNMLFVADGLGGLKILTYRSAHSDKADRTEFDSDE